MASRRDLQDKVKVLFEHYDEDKNGYIDYPEFIKFMYEYFGIRAESEEVNEMINDLFAIADGNGMFNRKDEKLNFSEVLEVVKLLPDPEDAIKQPKKAICRVLFNMVDKNRGDSISRKEMVAFLKKIGADFHPEEINDMIIRIDKNQNQMIEFEEFLDLYNL